MRATHTRAPAIGAPVVSSITRPRSVEAGTSLTTTGLRSASASPSAHSMSRSIAVAKPGADTATAPVRPSCSRGPVTVTSPPAAGVALASWVLAMWSR